MNKLLMCMYVLTTPALVTLAACSGTPARPLNRDIQKAHAERNCRVTAATQKDYAINARGQVLSTSPNVAYVQCMRLAGFIDAS